MKTRGARRKKPSQRPPGSAQAAVIQPPPRSDLSIPSACSRDTPCASSSASSTSARIGSGAEELDILLFPGDSDLLAFAAAELRVPLSRHLGEHPLAADCEVELDEVAEVLDEDHLALRAVEPAGAVGVDHDRRGPDGDECLVPDRAPVARRHDARANIVLVGDHEAVAVALDDAPTNDV